MLPSVEQKSRVHYWGVLGAIPREHEKFLIQEESRWQAETAGEADSEADPE